VHEEASDYSQRDNTIKVGLAEYFGGGKMKTLTFSPKTATPEMLEIW
jgi:hypothetical protein